MNYVNEFSFIKLIFFFQVVQRILEAHTNVKDLTSLQAKLHFIKAWQALPEYGLSLFVVKFAGSKKEVRKKYLLI